MKHLIVFKGPVTPGVSLETLDSRAVSRSMLVPCRFPASEVLRFFDTLWNFCKHVIGFLSNVLLRIIVLTRLQTASESSHAGLSGDPLGVPGPL